MIKHIAVARNSLFQLQKQHVCFMKHTLTLLQGVRYTCGPYGGPERHQVEVISVGERKNQV